MYIKTQPTDKLNFRSENVFKIKNIAKLQKKGHLLLI